jgi:alpha-tubulin suppressor-like RCC1 family protein
VTLSSGALTGVTSVAAGRGHTCAVRVDSTVVCWGDNRSGQLGIANNLKSSSSTALQVVADASRAAFTGVVMVAAGAEHTCALLFDGTIKCWGDNTAGQATGRVGTENVATPFPLLTAVPRSPSTWRRRRRSAATAAWPP